MLSEPEFEIRCKARDVGLETFVECLEDDPDECEFSMPLAGIEYCASPVRVYVVKNLKK